MKIGDWVRIQNPGYCYDEYDTWAKENNLRLWEDKEAPKKNSEGVIIAINSHFKGNPKLYGVRIKNQDFIMGEEGLKIIYPIRNLLRLIGD